MRWFAVMILLACAAATAAGTLVDIPLGGQINIGLGDAITDHTSFGSDAGGAFVRRALTLNNGAGGWYFGPRIDLVKAGYGPYVDLSGPGTTVEYRARYFQGNGNTDPYGDAPIFIQLIDINGKSGGLGMSYGPNPNPTYPEWITCTDEVVVGDWPTDPDFDISKVVAVMFFGTDWAGVGNDFVEIQYLRFSDLAVHNPIPLAEAKTKSDGETVEIGGAVSAVFGEQFYIQDPLRSCGIQVRASTAPGVGSSVVLRGTVQSDASTGELYVAASEWNRAGAGKAKPLGMTTRALGGGTLGRQRSGAECVGLNNIGLLVSLFGRVTGIADDGSYTYLSDGCPIGDGGPYKGVRIDLSGIPFWQRKLLAVGNIIAVTGVSSLYQAEGGVVRPVLRPRSSLDIHNYDSTGNEPKTLRVLVVNFDPFCPGYSGARTSAVFGWNNPRTLTDGYITDLANCSAHWCRYEVVDWFDADYHPYFEDGFRYSPDDYVYAWQHRHQTPLHEGTADYIRLVTDKAYPHNQPFSVTERIANDEIDEVFFFGAPGGFAGWEAAMAGPSPFFVNGGIYTVPEAKRNFVIMGFNYERGVDCMLENFCHRTECVMSRVYSPPDWWFPTYPPSNNWDKFRMFDKIKPDQAACGICHFAPNSTSDYDWGNTRYVWSTCDDWLYNWPNLLGDVTRRWVNCTEWGNGDMRLHHIWWLTHLPKAAGINPDGKQNNWWKYTCDFNNYPESR